MTTTTLLSRLTALAESEGWVRPEVRVRDGVISLWAASAGADTPPRHVAYLGLAREGWRRLAAKLKRLAEERC